VLAALALSRWGERACVAVGGRVARDSDHAAVSGSAAAGGRVRGAQGCAAL